MATYNDVEACIEATGVKVINSYKIQGYWHLVLANAFVPSVITKLEKLCSIMFIGAEPDQGASRPKLIIRL
jgi:hypothetical protein